MEHQKPYFVECLEDGDPEQYYLLGGADRDDDYYEGDDDEYEEGDEADTYTKKKKIL